MYKTTRRLWILGSVAVALVVGKFVLAGQEKKDSPESGGYKIVHYADLKWSPALPGVEVAVLDGDPEKPGAPYAILLKCADGAGSKPHWHANDSSATIIKGTYMLGIGEQFDLSKTQPLTAGDFVFLPKRVPHFDTIKGETIIYAHGIGPVDFNWVNPADDPAKAAKPQK